MPVAERAALEKQRTQESEADRDAASMEAGRAGREGRGITEEDISRGAEGRSDGPGPMTDSLIRDIYFDFDSYTLKGDDLPRLRDLATWLKGNKRSLVTIEGHCDERGSIEYNMALGQKRAEAVREYLLTLGVDRGRIKTISYGKETPIDPGRTEEAWAKNRRAHMMIE
jgi:peptidoglycan-associated lipoprotein